MEASWASVYKALFIINFSDKGELNILAGEYVLAVLSPDERAEIEQEMSGNGELVTAVGFWRDRFLEMVPLPVPIAPTSDL